LAASEYWMRPLPVPLAGEVMLIQSTSGDSDAVQPHPPAVAIPNSPAPPPAGCEAEAGESSNPQPWPWFTVKVRPAIERVPERAGPSVRSTVNATVPLPDPFEPAVIAIHGTRLDAFHEQPPAVETDTDPVPPDEGTDWLSGAIENVQPCPCDTVNVCPAMASVPLREGPVVAAAVNPTLPLPAPVAPLVMLSHGALLDAVQAQPGPAVTATDPAPPAAGTDWFAGAIE
jgi:hypothetical protein